MADLIKKEADGSLTFGDYTLAEKTKQDDFKSDGSSYKVKTYNEITRLERDGVLVYESVPGTNVTSLKGNDDGLSFKIQGSKDAQITVGVEPQTSYGVKVAGENIGVITSNLGGKLSFSVELEDAGEMAVEVVRA